MGDTLISKYKSLLHTRPNDELVKFSLGKALMDAGRIDEAEAQFKAAVLIKPDWMIPTMLLAKIAGNRGDTATAKAYWEKGLELAIAQHHDDPAEECRAELAKLG